MAESEQDQSAGRPYRVLSLDGGGMRGIYTAAFLARLTDQFARTRGASALDLGRGFDLYHRDQHRRDRRVRVSNRRPMTEVVGLYREHGPKIFPHRIAGKRSAIYRASQGSRFVREGDAALRSALEGVLDDVTMLEVFEGRGISLAIPTVC